MSDLENLDDTENYNKDIDEIIKEESEELEEDNLEYDENGIPYGPDNPKEDELTETEDDAIEYGDYDSDYGWDGLDWDEIDKALDGGRISQAEYNRQAQKRRLEMKKDNEEEVPADWRESFEHEKTEPEETGEIQYDTLTPKEEIMTQQALEDEEKSALEERYPEMVKDDIPYRQDFTSKEEPDEELRKRYSDMDPDNI